MLIRRLAFDEAPLATTVNGAAGIQFVTPTGHALFLKRGPNCDHPGTWCWPGGGIEGDETPEQAARRETAEETGFKAKEELSPIDHQADDEVAFTTFGQGVPEPFSPHLNEEHVAHAWAPLSDPPLPLHPGVEKTIAKQNAATAKDCFAFDRATVRRIDPHNGHLHVATTNISKANVCPYLGREIPDWQDLKLEPEKIYNLFRDPQELAKAAPTFNNLPLLRRHVENTAADHNTEDVIGSTGTDANFTNPYLQNSLVIWDGPYIEAVEDESQKELSSAYRYRADMTPGVTSSGEKFDGVMRDIIGNHVALVKEGRAGSDVVVGDSKEELNMSKSALSLKAVMARGALAAFLAPKLAQDAKIPLSLILGDVTAKNFKEKTPSILKGITDAIKGKLAKDEKADGLAALLDALADSPVVDDGDPMDDATFVKDDVKPIADPTDPPKDPDAKVDPMEAIKTFLASKLSPEDMAQIEQMVAGGANDEPPAFPGMPKSGEKKDTPVIAAKDKDMVTKEDADKMVKGATDAAIRIQSEIRSAEKLIAPYVGELAKSYPTAAETIKHALLAMDVKGVEKIDDVNALTVILKQQKVPGEKVSVKSAFAMDAKKSTSFAERHPGAARISIA